MKILFYLLATMIFLGCSSDNVGVANNEATTSKGVVTNPSLATVEFVNIKGSGSLPASSNQSVKMGGKKNKQVSINGEVITVGSLGGSDTFVENAHNGYVVGGSAIPMPKEEVEGTEVSDLAVHAFVEKDGVIKDLGTLGGSYSSASSVNSNGVIVGGSQIANGDYSAFIYQNNSLSALPNLTNFQHGWAYSINDTGTVVGEMKSNSGELRAVVWVNGAVYDLNSFLPAGSQWVLTSAKVINNAGLIQGVGKQNGIVSYFQLQLNFN